MEIRENEEQLRFCALAAKALPPVLPTIFKYLNTRELMRCSAVCKTWKEEAEREFARRTIEVLPIAIENEDKEDPDYPAGATFEEVNSYLYSINPNHLANFIGIVPAQSFIFYDDSHFCYELIRTLRGHYMYQLRNRVGYIAVSGISINTEEIQGSKNRALGVFIPDINKFHAYGSTCRWYDIHDWAKRRDGYVHRQVTNLMETPDEGGHCIIVFKISYEDEEFDEFKNAWLKTVNARPRTGSIAVWGANVEDMASSGMEIMSDVSTHWLQTNIRGISVRSYSVSVDLSLSPSQRARILEKFKQAISLRRLTNAFAIVPVSKNESFATRLAKTTDFRTIFPNITLTTIYNAEELAVYTANSVDEGPVCELYDHIAYLIITRQ